MTRPAGFDATYQSARSQYDANLHRAEQARAGLLPQAGLTAGVTRTQSNATFGPVSVERYLTNQSREPERVATAVPPGQHARCGSKAASRSIWRARC